MAPHHGINCDCAQCHHLGPPLDPIRLAADPAWSVRPEGSPLYIELCASYGAAAAFTLWELAAELFAAPLGCAA